MCCWPARPAGVDDFEEGSAHCRLEMVELFSLTVCIPGDREHPSSFETGGAELCQPGWGGGGPYGWDGASGARVEEVVECLKNR